MPEKQFSLHSRKRFLEVGGTLLGGLGVKAIIPNIAYANNSPPANVEGREENKERQPFKGDITFGIVKGVRFSDEQVTYKDNPREVLARIEEMLKVQHVDVVLTPEFSFGSRIPSANAITLEKSDSAYKIGEIGDQKHQSYLEELQRLAKQYKTDIYAATFNINNLDKQEKIQMDPFVETSYDNVMLHINSGGEIVGIKRKDGKSPEGDFSVKKEEKEYRFIPMICGEISIGSVLDEEASKTEGWNIYKPTVPEWIKQGGFDGFLHPQEQADVYFNSLALERQRLPMLDWQRNAVESAKKGFKYYYEEYFPYMKSGAPIVTSDLGIAAAMTEDGKPMTTYTDTPKYSISRILR